MLYFQHRNDSGAPLYLLGGLNFPLFWVIFAFFARPELPAGIILAIGAGFLDQRISPQWRRFWLVSRVASSQAGNSGFLARAGFWESASVCVFRGFLRLEGAPSAEVATPPGGIMPSRTSILKLVHAAYRGGGGVIPGAYSDVALFRYFVDVVCCRL